MTILDFETVLETFKTENNVPWSFHQFDSPQELPFMSYVFTDETPIIADGTNYLSYKNIQLELYTDAIDASLEAKLETALLNAGLRFRKDYGYIESEKLYMTAYQMEV
jgi:hypothetical protein